MHLKLTIEYNGTNYCGWQLQNHRPTIQGTLEEALFRLLGEPIRLRAAGRTDAGVHALAQVACVYVSKAVDLHALQKGLNALTPPDIVVRRVEPVPEDFNPRRDARSRVYLYRIWNYPWPSAFCGPYSWHIAFPLNLTAMEKATAHLVGSHDFSSFQATGSDARHPVRTVLENSWRREDEFLLYTIEAQAFLRHMVRNLVGTLVEVGRGAMSEARFLEVFHAHDRTLAGPNAPAQGLFLVEVKY
jgi:tRNA pseudouridine38-40 synthase